MSITPFTMEDVINGVLAQMRYAPGRDVQIHLQEGIKQDANILYRTLMRKYWWRDFRCGAIVSTDSAGLPVPAPVVSVLAPGTLTRYSDIYGVYLDNKASAPLPLTEFHHNAGNIRTPTVANAHTNAVFRIFPVKVYTDLGVSFRSYPDTDFDLGDNVPFYKDILVLGTAHLLCMKSGINAELTQALKAQFESLVQTFRMDEVMPLYTTPGHSNGIPTEWFVPS